MYRYRYIVIGVMVALCLFGGAFGLSLGKHVTQSGFYDDGSQSVKASIIGDKVYGRDRTGHIVAIFKAPDGKTVNDAAWAKQITDELNKFQQDHPDQIVGWAGYLRAPDTTSPIIQGMVTQDKKYTFVTIPLKGETTTPSSTTTRPSRPTCRSSTAAPFSSRASSRSPTR